MGAMASLLGEPPEVESRDGAGERVTELVWLIRCDRLGKVSEADELSNGQCPWNGEGEVGVMRPGGLGVSGEVGNTEEASLSNIWRMLWMTSPAPEHLSAKSFLERKHRAFPFIWNFSMSIFSKSNSFSQYCRN